MIVINTEHLGNVHQRKKYILCFFSLLFFSFPIFGGMSNLHVQHPRVLSIGCLVVG